MKMLYIYILIFVDNILICSKKKNLIYDVKKKLFQRFRMKDIGKVDNYIGITINYDQKNNKLTLNQTKYIESLIKKYKLENSKCYETPMKTNLKLEGSNEINTSIQYRNLIGELLYISTGTRPDITFSVNYLSRYQNCYDETHYKYALRVLKYLYLTKNFKLAFTKNCKIDVLDCFVNSDWTGDTVDRKSTSGYIIRLFGNPILWKTHKQNSVVKSSTFAEYVALSKSTTEVKFITEMLNVTFKVKISKPIKIYEDNLGALTIAKFGKFTKNSKHIEV